MAETKRIALLIDTDNVSPKNIGAVIAELQANYGEIIIKRAYGNWESSAGSAWKRACLDYSLRPIQQFAYTKGKNATDIAMVIEAMDILHGGRVDCFCLVTSDSDFTSLVVRLREGAMEVIGIGEEKTPRPFRDSCNVFRYFSNLMVNQSDDEDSLRSAHEGMAHTRGDALTVEEVSAAIDKLAAAGTRGEPGITLGELGSKLSALFPDFDVRSFGYTQLKKFVQSLEGFEVLQNESTTWVYSVIRDTTEDALHSFVQDQVTLAGKGGIRVSQLGIFFHKEFPEVNLSRLGYVKFSKFLADVPGVVLVEKKDGSWLCRR